MKDNPEGIKKEEWKTEEMKESSSEVAVHMKENDETKKGKDTEREKRKGEELNMKNDKEGVEEMNHPCKMVNVFANINPWDISHLVQYL